MAGITLKKKILFTALLVLLSLVIFLVFGEIYVRLTSGDELLTPEERRLRSLSYRPAVFARHVFAPRKIDAVGWGGARWPINQKGYRGREFEAEKPEGTVRIMFYGGSSVFDSHATDDQDWPHRIEKLLHDRGLKQVEVINAGIPGHASIDAVGRLLTEGQRFHPDYLVLYTGWNDIKTLHSDASMLEQIRPYRPKSDPRIHYTGSLDRLFCNISDMYLLLRTHYHRSKLSIGDEGSRPQGEPVEKLSPLSLRQYRLNVETFVDLARNIGAEPILMPQARLVHPDNTEDQRRRIRYDYVRLTHEALCRAFDKIDTTLREVAANKGARLLGASTRLNGREEYFLDHVHLNLAGSAALAAVLAPELTRIIEAKEAVQKDPCLRGSE
jgi:lysophospholipase L1-like esterase